jgi:hypothetical protein
MVIAFHGLTKTAKGGTVFIGGLLGLGKGAVIGEDESLIDRIFEQ